MNLAPVEAKALQSALKEIANVRLAYVFGSMARGTADPQSDIDVAVLADHALHSMEKMNLTAAIARVTGRAVDLVDLRSAGQPLLGEILRDGVRLVGNADQHADLATRAALDANDFFPYVQRMLNTRRQAWIG